MQVTHKFLTLITVSFAIALAGCTTTTHTTTTTTTTTTSSGDTASGGVLPEFKATDYGPYTTVMIGDAEMRQGKYPIGKYGGELLRALVASDPKTFNYWASDDSSSSMFGGFMFSGLTTNDPFTGDVISDLAEEFRMEPDQVTYVTRLRKGLKWSDGKPITSADVAYTWNTIIAGGYGNTSMRDVTQVEGKSPKCIVVDELTNKFVTPKPFAPFIRLLAQPIAPKHVFEPITSGPDGLNKFNQKWSRSSDPNMMKTFVTSGPYVLSRFVPSQRVELVHTNNYYVVNKDGRRLPYVDKMIFTFVPDANTLQLKFRSGEIDITTVRARDLQTLLSEREKGNFKIYRLGPALGSTFLMFNMNARKNAKGESYVDPAKSKWFNDVNFRQAVNHAINREHIIANYFKGIAHPEFGPESTTSPWYNSELKPFKQDLSYSASLLEKSGFTKKGDVLYDKDGHKVEFDMILQAGSTFMDAAGQMIQADLAQLGMKVNLQTVEFNALLDRMDNTKKWESGIFALTGDPLEPNNGANVWKSNGRLHIFDLRYEAKTPNTVVTDARPWEKEIDGIFTNGPLTFDKAARKKLYDRFQQVVYDEAPFIYLTTAFNLIGARNTIGNYNPTPLTAPSPTDGLHNLDEIYKTDAQRTEPAPLTGPAPSTTKGGPTVTSTPTSTSTSTSSSTTTTTTTSTPPESPQHKTITTTTSRDAKKTKP